VVQDFFFNRVLVEPGDGAQPPGDGRPSATPGFQLPGEALDVGAADGEQAQAAGPARGGELAQVERVRLAGKPAVSGQVAGEGEPFGIGERGLDRGERGGMERQWSSGTSRPGWDPSWASAGSQR
jgi:hypothetical protein